MSFCFMLSVSRDTIPSWTSFWMNEKNLIASGLSRLSRSAAGLPQEGGMVVEQQRAR